MLCIFEKHVEEYVQQKYALLDLQSVVEYRERIHISVYSVGACKYSE